MARTLARKAALLDRGRLILVERRTLRWRGLDSNFQYAGGVKLVVVPLTPGCLGRVGSRRNDPATAIGAPRIDTIRPGGRMAGVGRRLARYQWFNLADLANLHICLHPTG
jgi:hypothetical protein